MLLSIPVLAVLTALAASSGARQVRSRRAHRDIDVVRSSDYTLLEKHQGKGFFNNYQFFTGGDPTGGNVKYTSQANGGDLAYVQSDETVVMKVDNKAQVPVNGKRRSIRIQSKHSFSTGLIIADIKVMPYGCSVWPAYWMVGPNWPTNGEIDIIEGINGMTNNQLTVHTADNCTLNKNPTHDPFGNAAAKTPYTGHIINTQCASSPSNNAGCAFVDPSSSSFGSGFNSQGGVVSATLINDNGITMWFFPRGQVPDDIKTFTPDPSSWTAPPIGFWSSDTCSIGDCFNDMSIVFDITICGGWAGAAYSAMNCPGTCGEAVANPRNYDNAQWQLNYVAVYSTP